MAETAEVLVPVCVVAGLSGPGFPHGSTLVPFLVMHVRAATRSSVARAAATTLRTAEIEGTTKMKLTQAIVSLGIGLLVATATPGLAGDWNNGAGGLKDYGGSGRIPVPVPAPVPEVFNWYLRADASLGWQSGTSIRESGLVLGLDRADPPGTFGTNSRFFDHDQANETQFAFGGGFGYYFTPQFRGDVTFDVRRDRDSNIRGAYQYTQVDDQQNPIGRVVGHSQDEATHRSWLTMANLYWDLLPRGSRFSPYVGAGLGLGVHSLTRTHYTEEETCGSCGPTRVYDGSDRKVHYSLAAAATAGMTYTISPQYALDFSYRYLFIGGFESTMPITSSASTNVMRSTLHFSDEHEHQVRAGLRVNVF